MGERRNAGETKHDAICALQRRRREDARKLDRLRLAVKAGVDALDRGDYTEVEDADLDAFLDELATTDTRPR
jgi:antitoxin ParD1/3/4